MNSQWTLNEWINYISVYEKAPLQAGGDRKNNKYINVKVPWMVSHGIR